MCGDYYRRRARRKHKTRQDMAVLAAMPTTPLIGSQENRICPEFLSSAAERERIAFSMAAVLVDRTGGEGPRVKRVKSSPRGGSQAPMRVRRAESPIGVAYDLIGEGSTFEDNDQSHLGRQHDPKDQNMARKRENVDGLRRETESAEPDEDISRSNRPQSLESLGFSELTLRSSMDTSTSSLRAQRTNGGSRSRRRSPQEIADFHRESCQLFQSFSTPTSRRNSIVGNRARIATLSSEDATSIRSSPVTVTIPGIEVNPSIFQSLNLPAIDHPRCNTPEAIAGPIVEESQKELEPIFQRFPPTTIDWTSDETRRKEYEKIDRSWSGIRGMWKRATPKWCHPRNSRPGFYRASSDDGGSVRRFRIDLPQDEASDDRVGPNKLVRWWTSL